MNSYVRYIGNVRTMCVKLSIVTTTIQENHVKYDITEPQDCSVNPALNTIPSVTPMLGFLYPPPRFGSVAITTRSCACIVQWSCEFEWFIIFVIRENYLVNYVQKLQ